MNALPAGRDTPFTAPARRLDDLVAAEAPLEVRRAAAILLAVARAVQRCGDTGRTVGALESTDVTLHADGSVHLDERCVATRARAGDPTGPTPAPDTAPSTAPNADRAVPGAENAVPSAVGASIGRLFFELLVGRRPLDRADAFEPAITTVLAPDDCALLARSCSPSAGQWPSVDNWATRLAALAGGLATPPPPAEQARARRRVALLSGALSLLIAATIAVVLLAPSWWDAANPVDPDPTDLMDPVATTTGPTGTGPTSTGPTSAGPATTGPGS